MPIVSSQTDVSPVSDTAAELAELARGRPFAFELYAHLRGRNGNLLVSPASIQVALAMTYAGARGETATQLAEVMHFSESSDLHHRSYGAALRRWNGTATATLRVANRIYIEKTALIEPEFLAITRDAYDAEVRPADFIGAAEAARGTINAWVEELTARCIRDLLPPGSLTPLTRVVLANAVYFKGVWQIQFAPKKTERRKFAVPGAGRVDVQMMTTKARFAYARHNDGLGILEMPYAGGELSMIWLLPEADDGLPTLETKLSADALMRWRGASEMVEVEVSVPRFRLEPPTIEIKELLATMGMELPFEGRADFSAMARLRDGLYISDVYHKAFIEVNEEGAEASAASAVVMSARSVSRLKPERARFIADHPFLFLLMDRRTDTVMFLGRVTDPR